jgi:hypothetical protein
MLNVCFFIATNMKFDMYIYCDCAYTVCEKCLCVKIQNISTG